MILRPLWMRRDHGLPMEAAAEEETRSLIGRPGDQQHAFRRARVARSYGRARGCNGALAQFEWSAQLGALCVHRSIHRDVAYKPRCAQHAGRNLWAAFVAELMGADLALAPTGKGVAQHNIPDTAVGSGEHVYGALRSCAFRTLLVIAFDEEAKTIAQLH